MAQQNTEEMLNELRREVQRLKDLHEIQELMSRYFYLHAANMLEEKVKLFALKTPGVRIEIADRGVYEGAEHIKKHYISGEGSQDFRGKMYLHALTTPSIQVAGDGKTAKGVWISPGNETTDMGSNRKLSAYWSWGYMAADFVKEDGEWKIWHYHVYGIFKCLYDKSWVEYVDKPNPEAAQIMGKPDRPTTYHHEYSTDTVREYIPAPPDPYETFDESKAY
jgi:hypothetical protein